MDRELSPGFIFAFVLCTALFAAIIQIDKANIGKRAWIAPPVIGFVEKGHARTVVLSFKNVGIRTDQSVFWQGSIFSRRRELASNGATTV